MSNVVYAHISGKFVLPHLFIIKYSKQTKRRFTSNGMEWHRLEIGDRQQKIQTNTYLNLIMYSNSDAQPNVNMYRRLWDSNAVK